MKHDRQQQALPLAEAEGERAERAAMLENALKRAGADLHLAEFVRLVLAMTRGGNCGFVRSYAELAQRRRDGLWCSIGKVRTTVERALDLGLVAAREQRYVTGGQRGNAYAINWDGVRRLVGLPAGGEPAALTAHPPALTAHPPALTAHPPALTAHPYKEITSSCPLLTSDVVVERAGDADDAEEDKAIARKWEAIKATACEALHAAWRSRHDAPTDDDRRLVLSAAILSHTRLAETWLADAARMTGRTARESPRGLLWRTLARGLPAFDPRLELLDDAGLDRALTKRLAAVRAIVDRQMAARPAPTKLGPFVFAEAEEVCRGQ